MQSFRYRSLTTIVVASTVLFGIGSTVEANASAQAKIKHRSVAITKPPAPTGLKATSVTDSTVKLVWNATRGSTKGYNVYIGGDKAGHTTAPSYTARGLKASTVYRFKVMATTSKGSIHSVKSSVLKVKTKTSPVAVPVAPSTPTASETTETQTTLYWNSVSNATSYEVYRDGVKINNTPHTTTEFIDTPLTPDTSYVYTVKALNTAGASTFSAARSVKTLQKVPSTPKAPTSPSHTATNVNLSWSAVSGATGYNVYRNGTKITSSLVSATSYNNTGVSSGTSYSYTISAVNSRGSSVQSPALTVTTNPASPAKPTATNVTSNSVSLSWISVNGATSYNVYRNGVKITPTAISLPSMVDSTVSGGTTYSYTIVANGSGGASTASSPLSVTTTTAANQAPPAPTGLKTTSVTSDSVGLAWDATGGNTNGYSVYIAGGFIGWTSTPDYNATGLTPSTSYDFQVVATTSDNSIYSPKSSVLSVTTQPVTVSIPVAPNAPTVSGTTQTQTTLSWNSVSGATSYDVYRGTTKANSSPITSTSFTDTGLSASTTYSYTVKAVNSSGASPASGALSVTTPAIPVPAAPNAPTASGTTQTQTTLSWNSVSGATSYDVYRGATKANSSPITSTSFTDTGLSASTTYSYTVKAVNSSGASSASGALSVTTLAIPVPVAPNSPTASGTTQTQTTLSWNSVSGATSYDVYRGATKANSSPVASTSFTDTGLSASTTYSYTVKAVNSSGASPASGALSVTTSAAANQAPPTPTGLKTTSVTSDSVGLAWDATGGNTNGYSVYIAGGFIGWTSTPTYSATGLTPSTSYDFQVVATTSDNSIYSPKSSVLSVTTLAAQGVPSAPSGLSSPSHSTSTVSLSWSASSGATGYNVYRNGAKITSSAVTTTSYSDSTVAAGTTYSYTVDAVNSNGPSGQSSALSVSTTPSAPSAPTATVVTSPVSASLTWGSVLGATSYDVYRNGAKITSSAVTTTSYSDTAVTAGTTYSYTVTANGLGGTSAQSPSVQFTAAASDPTGLPQGNLPGWTSVFGEDFTRDSTLGSFTTDYTSTMGAYPYPWTDTSHNVRSNPGYYYPEKTLSVSGGKLDAWLHYDSTLGRYLVAAPTPKLPTMKYGRFAMRLRADQIPGYKIAPLLWPDSESWPNDGEIDFPEGDLNGSAPGAFAHWASASGGQDAFTATGISLAQWHTYETVWSPTSVKFYVDGNLIGTSTKNVPQNPMHWVLQFETTITSTAPPTSAQGHVQVDWIKAYSYTPGTP